MTEERRCGQVERRLEKLGGRRAGDQRIAGTVAGRICDGIRRKQLTVRQTAELSGLAVATVHEAMHGRVDPRLSTLIALAHVLDIPLTELVKDAA